MWNLFKWFRRPKTVDWATAKTESEEFIAWAEMKEGNVYQLFQDYLQLRTGLKVCVSFDWMACPGIHRQSIAWETYEKLPKWFKRWVNKNGSGRYRTYKKC